MEWDEFLSEEEQRHYRKFLGAGSVISFVHPDRDQPWNWTSTTITDGPPQPGQQAALREIEQRKTRDGLLVRRGNGPVTCSSSQVLALSPEICWDVCLYYRRLGIGWKATRKEIREALHLHKATVGAGRPDLIYAAKQLLDEDIRREYDRVPLGMLFLKDKDVVALLKRAAQKAASAMAARGFPDMTPEDVLGTWGFNVSPPDGPGGEGEDGQAPAGPSPSPIRVTATWASQWGWYRDPLARYEQTSDMFGDVPLYRLRELEEWQLMLVREFSRRGVTASFAIGLCDAETFLIRPAPNPGIIVILLGDGEPTRELAADAVDMWGLTKQPKRLGDMYAKLRQGRRAG